MSMISVTLRRPGRQRAVVDLNPNSTIDDFRQGLGESPEYEGIIGSAFNVNEEAKDDSYVLQNGDVLTVRQKVVGGSQ